MYSNFIAMYQDLGAASKEGAEQAAERSARVVEMVQQSYRLWLGLMTESANDAAQAFRDLAACRTPADAFEVQRAWIEASNARAVANLKTLMELTGVLVAGLGPDEEAPAALEAPVAPAAPPVDQPVAAAPAPAPVPEPAPAPAPAPAPVVKAEAAPVRETVAPAAEAPVAGDAAAPFVQAVAEPAATEAKPAAPKRQKPAAA